MNGRIAVERTIAHPTLREELDQTTTRFHHYLDLHYEHATCGNSFRSVWYRLRQALAAARCSRLQEMMETSGLH